MIDVLTASLRSNPRFRLLSYDRLEPRDQDAFRILSEDQDFFGVLVPPEGSMLPIKSVSCDAALLVMALRETACLPHLLTRLFGSHASERLRELILDGVLEIAIGGRFLSGGSAMELLGDLEPMVPVTRLSRLSYDAITYAAALGGVTVTDLATRLYRFNAIPGTPALYRRIGDGERLQSFLFGDSGLPQMIRSRWRQEAIGESWLAWRSGDATRPHPYKLYISPTLEHLPPMFEKVVELLAKAKCSHFKHGNSVPGLLRPDKLVAYFDTLDDLYRAGEMIGAEVSGTVAQGVPFTAPVDSEGLLSWGMDPPRFEQVLTDQRYQSWRQWLTGRIAVCVAAARESGVDPHRFVRNRIELDGVDPVSWNPNLAIWRGPVGTELEVP